MRSFNLLDLIQLLIAGTAVGVMFSVITIQSNSIFPAALIHGIWNLIIIGGIVDIATEQVGHYDTTLFTYTLTSNSTLMTGGAFGIEASLPAIIGYIAVTVFAIILIKKKTNGQLNA